MQTAGSGISIDINHVSRRFDGGVTALDDVSLSVTAGEFVAILGPSGCGKSTLLRLIAGLDRASAGAIGFGISSGKIESASSTSPPTDASKVLPYASVPPAGIAYVFQDAHLLPWRNVYRNVALPLELAGKKDRDRVLNAIEQVGLSDALRRYPNQLSGGMRMRVSLARAMVTDPQLLLLDEPFAALDEITRQRLDEQLRQLWQSRGMTVLFVTHSTAEAVFLANRAVVMSARPGRIVLDRAIDLPPDRNVALRATAQFAGQMRDIFAALESGGALR